jgi:hypothetical protein
MGFHPLYVEKVEKNGAFFEADDKIVRKYPNDADRIKIDVCYYNKNYKNARIKDGR